MRHVSIEEANGSPISVTERCYVKEF